MYDFDVQQLRYFIEAARFKSMSQAARNLYVSPQGLSKSIRRLEESLGEDLFVRGTGGIELTAFGAFFLQRAQAALLSFDSVQASPRDFRNHVRRTIALGIPPECTTDFGGTLSVPKLYEIQQAYPTVTFVFSEVAGNDLIHQLDTGILQFGIGLTPTSNAYQSARLDTFPLVVLVRRDNPLSHQKAITARDLATGRVIAPGNPEGIEHFMRTSGYASTVEKPTIDLLSRDSSELILSADIFVVKAEQHALRTTASPEVALVPLVHNDGEPVSVGVDLIWRRAMPLGRPERGLIDFIVKTYANRPREALPF